MVLISRTEMISWPVVLGPGWDLWLTHVLFRSVIRDLVTPDLGLNISKCHPFSPLGKSAPIAALWARVPLIGPPTPLQATTGAICIKCLREGVLI
jgi:hypothetical protein